MNKYKIYIMFILIFVLAFIPLNYVYGDKYSFLMKEPPEGHIVTRKEFYASADFLNENEKKIKKYQDKWSKKVEENPAWTPTEEGEVKAYNAYKYSAKYIEQPEGLADAIFIEQKKFDFLVQPPDETIKKDQYDKAIEFCDYFDININRKYNQNPYDIVYLYYNVNNKKDKVDILSTKMENAKKYRDQYKKEKDNATNPEKSQSTSISTDITNENFINQFSLDDENNNNGPIEPILNLIQYVTNIVLGIIQVFSGFLMVVTIAYTGFKMILSTDANNNGGLAANLGFDDLGNSSPAGKKRLQEFMQHLMIGTIITFTSTTIARAIFNILTKV